MTQEALRMALEALENHTAIKHPQQIHYRDKAITAIKEALAQPEQEPVAVVDANDDGYWADILPDRNVKVGQLLYTHPPQRTWVGLTDDEIAQGCKESWVTEQAFQSAVWWAEDKLKEKNT
jgi:predicted esterase YcpF (UPF0227 family)